MEVGVKTFQKSAEAREKSSYKTAFQVGMDLKIYMAEMKEHKKTTLHLLCISFISALFPSFFQVHP